MIDPTSRVPSITRTSGSGSSLTGSQSRDSKCRSQYDNFTSTGTVFEATSELSSSTEALETVEEIPTSTSCSSSLGGPDESSATAVISHRPADDLLTPMTSILENQILNNSSSSNEHFISSKTETGSDQSDNERYKSLPTGRMSHTV